jgi:GGDEF domain-containing protein
MDEDPKSSNQSAGFSSSLKASAQAGLKDVVKEIVKDKAVKIIGTALGVIALGSIPLLKEKTCLPGWVLVAIGTSGIVVGVTVYAYFTHKRATERLANFEQQRTGLQGEIESLKKQIEAARPKAEKLDNLNELLECILEHLREVLKLNPNRPRDEKPRRALSVAALAIDDFPEIVRSHPWGVPGQLLDGLVDLVLNERRSSSDSVYRLGERVYIVSRFESATDAKFLSNRVRAAAGGISTGPEGEQLPRWSMSAVVAEINIPRENVNDLEQRIQNALDSAVAALKNASCIKNTVRVVERSP